MLRRIISYILFVLGLLIVLFFRKYSGELIPYPFLFYLSGFGMLFSGFLLLRYTPTATQSNVQKKVSEAIIYLKTKGERIAVDLTQCEIKEHHYIEEANHTEYPNDLLKFAVEHYVPALSIIEGTSKNNIQKVNVIQTILIYHYYNNRTGENETFISRVIPKDKITLTFYLDKQKYTSLFVDNADRSKYYFDLDFLNS